MAKPIKYCSVDGCERRCHTHGLCASHAWRMKVHGSVGEAAIAAPRSTKPRKISRPWATMPCFKCQKEFRCSQDVAAQTRVFCSRKCSDSVRDTKPKVKCWHCGKETLRHKNPANQGYNWAQKYCSRECQWDAQYKGGHIHYSGYRYIRVDRKLIYEHRHVMEQMLGRKLLVTETVHHKNGIRLDNRPENLELWSTRHCKGQRVEDKVAYALEILDLYPQFASLALAKRASVLRLDEDEYLAETSVYNAIRSIDGLA